MYSYDDDAKGYITVLSEYGKFPASKSLNAALVRLCPSIHSINPVVSERKGGKRGHEAAQRYYLLVPEFGHGHTHIYIMTALQMKSLFDRPWGAKTMHQKKASKALFGDREH